MTTADLLTEHELAARWQCHRNWLANMRCEGTGPRYAKLGRLVRYRTEDVEAYEAAHLVPAGARK